MWSSASSTFICDYCPDVLPQLLLCNLQLLRVLLHGGALPLQQQVGTLLYLSLTVEKLVAAIPVHHLRGEG